jgi:hypothetical protein
VSSIVARKGMTQAADMMLVSQKANGGLHPTGLAAGT